jgi:hypothetical protein
MFFRSARVLVIAVALIGVGAYQLFKGLYYKDVAKREAKTVGTLIYVHHGKGATYRYRFVVNGQAIIDESSACKTATGSSECDEGAQVLVYYDRKDLSETLLQEFGAASWESFFMGTWMTACGTLLVALHYLLNRGSKSANGWDPDPDEDITYPEPEINHVVPDK